mmetsp:Transcript_15983/g.24005  ORF Transcript_15983/g.24005 Transcript_15983/m.24005 type:complete len:871 (-) Transcript_15983:2384-4996(-)
MKIMSRLHNNNRGRSFSSGRQQTTTRVVNQKERLTPYYSNNTMGGDAGTAPPVASRTIPAAMTSGFATDGLAQNAPANGPQFQGNNGLMFSTQTQVQVPSFPWYSGQGQEVTSYERTMNSPNHQPIPPHRQWSVSVPSQDHHQHQQHQKQQQQQQMANYYTNDLLQPPYSILHSSSQQSSHYVPAPTILGGQFHQVQMHAQLQEEAQTRSTPPPPPPLPTFSSSSVLAGERSNDNIVTTSLLHRSPLEPPFQKTPSAENSIDIPSYPRPSASAVAVAAFLTAGGVDDPSSSIRNAMAELSSLSQRWTRSSHGENITSNGVKSKLPPAKTTDKKVKYSVKTRNQRKKDLAELRHAAASPASTTTGSLTATTASAEAYTKIAPVVVQHDVPMDTNWDKSVMPEHIHNSVATFDKETSVGMQNDLTAIGVKENRTFPITVQQNLRDGRSQMNSSDDNFLTVPPESLVIKTNNSSTDNRMSLSNINGDHDEEMEISDDEDGDNEQVTIDQSPPVKKPLTAGTNITHPYHSDLIKSKSSTPNISLALALRNDLAEKKLRLAMAQKRKALEMAKAKLLKAQIEKEEVLKTNVKNTELKRSDNVIKKMSNITAFSMKSLVIEGIHLSGPAEKIYPINLEASSTVLPSVEDSTSNITMKKHSDLSRSSSPIKENKVSSVEAEKLKLNLELAKRKLKLKTLLNAKAKQEAENNQGNSSADEKPKCEKDDTAKKSPSETSSTQVHTGQQETDKKETATELRRKQELLRESIKLSKETNKGLKDDKEIRELKELVEKQRRILQTQGAKITTCTKDIQQCNDRLQEINALKSESEMKLQNLVEKRAVMEKMIASVSKNIINSRRKRMKRKRNLNANDRTKRI